MSADAGDVIASALLASHIIQDIKIEDCGASKIDDTCEKKLFSMNCEDGQVYYITEETAASDSSPDGWSKGLPDSLGECDLGIFGDGFQLCYVDVVPPGESSFESVSSISVPEHEIAAFVQEENGSCAPAVSSCHDDGSHMVHDTRTEQIIKSTTRWSEKKTNLFLTLLKHFENEFVCRSRPKCSILNSIAGIMSSTYKDVDKDLCYKKWSNLLRTYRAYKQKNQTDWLYYNDMERLSASVGTRGMTAKQIRQRNRAFKYSRNRIRTFMNKTDEMQNKIHHSICNFQQKLNKLQKQSDEHLKNIFCILEENVYNGDTQSPTNESAVSLNDSFDNTSHCMFDLVDTIVESRASVDETQTEKTSYPLSTDYDLLKINAKTRSTLSSDDTSENLKPSIDISSTCDSVSNRDSPQEINRTTKVLNDNAEFLIPIEHHSWNSWDSLNSEAQRTTTISGSRNLIPINAPSIEINEPVQLIPQSDGTFHFVSLPDQNQNPVNEHSHLFGSLKKMTFTSNEGQYEPAACDTRKYSNVEPEGMERDISVDTDVSGNNPASQNELVILSRSQLDNMNSVVPLETTAVSLQLLPCSDDTFKLVVCPRENTEEDNVDTDNLENMTCSMLDAESGTKNPESWSLSIFTPICPVANIYPPESALNQDGDCVRDGYISEDLLEPHEIGIL